MGFDSVSNFELYDSIGGLLAKPSINPRYRQFKPKVHKRLLHQTNGFSLFWFSHRTQVSQTFLKAGVASKPWRNEGHEGSLTLDAHESTNSAGYRWRSALHGAG